MPAIAFTKLSTQPIAGSGDRGRQGGGTEFRLLTGERDERAAREYAHSVLAEAASRAGISQDELARATITQIVSRRRNVTGRPRRVEAPPGNYRTVELGDRGRLRAMHEGPLGDWIVYLEPDGGRAWAGRDLLSVLSELWELPHGRKDAWVHDVIETLAGHKTPLGVRYACPCCDFLTLTQPPSGSYEICPVCWWEDDNSQFHHLDYPGGANRPSLRQARATFQRLGVSKPRLLKTPARRYQKRCPDSPRSRWLHEYFKGCMSSEKPSRQQ